MERISLTEHNTDINYTVGTERIGVVLTRISLIVGDTITGCLSCKCKVVHIDCIREMITVASENGNTDVLNFNDVAMNFHKVVR